VLIAHKAVIHTCRANIPSRDRSIRIDSKRVGTLEGTWGVTGVRRIERGEGAIPVAQETVTQIVRVKVVSHDGSIRSKAAAKSTLKAPVPAPGASKVGMVCADIGMEIARATVMVAAGWSFLFAK
jgi:hypothetical protein